MCIRDREDDVHCAFIGTNGTGKSTLVNMILHPDNYLYDGKLIEMCIRDSRGNGCSQVHGGTHKHQEECGLALHLDSIRYPHL